MTKKILVIVTSLLLLAAGLLLAAETLKVTVKSTKLRSSPKFYAPAVATLQFGDSVQKIAEQGAWVQGMTSAGIQGWLHSSAVTQPKFSLTARETAGTEATADEVALAGKGFNEQVEKEYRKTANLNYTWVDRMAQSRIAETEMEKFFKEGMLGEFGGAK